MADCKQGLGTQLRETFENRDTISRRLKREALRRRITDRPGLSDEDREKDAAHNANVDTLAERCDCCEANLRASIENAGDSDDIGSVLVACEDMRTDEALHLQLLVRLSAEKVERAEAHIEALKKIPAEREKEAEKIVAKVKADLEKAGSGVDAQPAMLTGNATIAERQFDILARTVNTRSRAALLEVKAAQAELMGAYETATGARRDLDEAKAALLNFARKALAG